MCNLYSLVRYFCVLFCVFTFILPATTFAEVKDPYEKIQKVDPYERIQNRPPSFMGFGFTATPVNEDKILCCQGCSSDPSHPGGVSCTDCAGSAPGNSCSGYLVACFDDIPERCPSNIPD